MAHKAARKSRQHGELLTETTLNCRKLLKNSLETNRLYWMTEMAALFSVALSYEVINLPSERKMTVTGRNGASTAIDILFIEKVKGQTVVETRWGALVGVAISTRPVGRKMDERVWPIVRSCVVDLTAAR